MKQQIVSLWLPLRARQISLMTPALQSAFHLNIKLHHIINLNKKKSESEGVEGKFPPVDAISDSGVAVATERGCEGQVKTPGTN